MKQTIYEKSSLVRSLLLVCQPAVRYSVLPQAYVAVFFLISLIGTVLSIR